MNMAKTMIPAEEYDKVVQENARLTSRVDDLENEVERLRAAMWEASNAYAVNHDGNACFMTIQDALGKRKI